MEELFIVVPSSVSLADVANVLRRTWKLDEHLGVPYIELTPYSSAYVTEEELDDKFMEEFFLEEPGMPERLHEQFGDYRILAIRYRDPALAREMARALASSEIAEHPMLLDTNGTYLTPREFLDRLEENPDWDWFSDGDARA